MMLALYLLGVAMIVAAAATRTLPTATWTYRAPRLALAAWHTALAAIAISVATAFGSLLWRWPTTVDAVCAWWAWCVEALGGDIGPAAQITGWLIITVLLVLAVRGGAAIVRTWRAAASRAREHRQMLTLVGRHDPALDALVVDHPQPAAYALPDGTVVVTTGTLHKLPAEQVAAVLAHERAHTSGRHHLMMRIARALHTAFPGITAFADAHRQIDRLVELCADDAATRRHPRLDLARALVACAEAATVTSQTPVPVGAAAAHGGDTLERVNRLLDPPPPLPKAATLTITLSLAGTLALPLSIVALGQLFPALVACMPTT